MIKDYIVRGLILILFCSGLIVSCLDEIDFDTSGEQLDNLVIQGKLIKGTPSIAVVSISQISPYDGFERPRPVDASDVVLLDENQNALSLLPIDTGIYRLDIPDDQAGFSIQEGHAYRIRVRTSSGSMYESTLETLLPVPSPSGISLEWIEREELNEAGNIEQIPYLEFSINTPLSADSGMTKAFLKWEVEGCYRFTETTPDILPQPPTNTCYVTEYLNLDQVKVFNGSNSGQATLTGESLVEIPVNHRFANGYYLTVYQQSLTENGFDYWSQVSQIVERTGSIFEPKPGKITGNMYNPDRPDEEVFGYFYTSIQDTIRLYISPEDASTPTAFCPPWDSGEFLIPDICFDCLLLRNSTLEKPDYWEN